ncbi:MAG TPA: hypothetical protein VHZ54_04450 [Solirubrobacterales bacterium]|jgi:hypothetical protein|nr:hypothetical protein [Solirubrobacterales bacterium]
MRKFIATLIVASLSSVLFVNTAAAAQTEVDVRIEGRAETLFEGPVLVESDGAKASSDTEARSCNGIDSLDPENIAPEPTPTAAAADALGLIGESFDGQWYPGFNDYFITRWGPDPQSPGEAAYWGILVNDTFTDVGGCQYQLDGGDEALWVYDAFKGRPDLALFPAAAHYASGPRPLIATAELNQPIAVEVAAYEDDEEDGPAAAPGRTGSGAFADAEIAPVVTTAKGFERVDTKSSATVKSNAEGKATIAFAEPGWHRIKATVAMEGTERAIRSNRLDVCVTGGVATKALEGATSCGELPAADQVRVAPRIVGEVSLPTTGAAGGSSGGGGGTGGGSASPGTTTPPERGSSAVGSLKVSVPKVDRRLLAKGLVGLSWKVTDAGPGVRQWTVSSLTVGQKGALWVTRAKGTAKSATTIRLPRGHGYKLRFAIADASGQTSTVALGEVKVPKAGHPRRG